MGHPGLFFVYFHSFSNNNAVAQQIKVRNGPSSIWRWNLNPQSLAYESPPKTTRPGLTAQTFVALPTLKLWYKFGDQCDQIGRFFELWATFYGLWQQLICPNLPHSQAIFVTVSKSFIFLVKSFLSNFYRHLAIFIWSHCLPPSLVWYFPLCLFFLCS